jgi:hypothetical protein
LLANEIGSMSTDVERPWFGSSLEAPRSFAVISLILAVLSVAAVSTFNYYWGSVGVLLSAVGLGITPVVMRVWYNSDPLVLAKQPILDRYQEQSRALKTAVDAVAVLETARTNATDGFEETKQRIATERSELPNAQQQAEAQARIEMEKTRVAPLKRREQQSYADEQKDMGQLLQLLQQQHMAEAMAQPVEHADIDGVGPTMKRRLIAAGMITAGDVSAARVSAVPGFGQSRIEAVLGWRQGLEDAARRSLPMVVTANDTQAVKAKYSQQRDAIAREMAQTETDLAQSLKEIARWYSERPGVMDQEMREAATRFQADTAAVEGKLRAAREAQGEEKRLLDGLDAELAPYKRVTFGKYVFAVLLGRRGMRKRARAQLAACDDLIGDPETQIGFQLLPAKSEARDLYARALESRERGLRLLDESRLAWSPILAEQAFVKAAGDLQAVRAALPRGASAGSAT